MVPIYEAPDDVAADFVATQVLAPNGIPCAVWRDALRDLHPIRAGALAGLGAGSFAADLHERPRVAVPAEWVDEAIETIRVALDHGVIASPGRLLTG